MQRKYDRWFLGVILGLALAVGVAACSRAEHPAAAAVESFIQALADKDEARYVTLTCGDFEADALMEYDAFSLVKTRLEDLDCQVVSVEGDVAAVSCQGRIIATYGNENQVFNLDERRYQVLNQGGEWLVCGY